MSETPESGPTYAVLWLGHDGHHHEVVSESPSRATRLAASLQRQGLQPAVSHRAPGYAPEPAEGVLVGLPKVPTPPATLAAIARVAGARRAAA